MPNHSKILLASLLSVSLFSPAMAQDQKAAKVEAKATSNAVLDKNDPDYVKCRREPILGSRAKFRKICLTNREWEATAREGNRVTDDLITNMRAQSTSGS